MRTIFVNLPVADLAASTRFFTELGFTLNPDFCDDTASYLAVEENIALMLLTREKFRSFINDDIADAHASTEVLTCLSASSREEVDELVEKAIAAGGKPWKPSFAMGPMYGGSFTDLDGHVFELMYMDPSAMG